MRKLYLSVALALLFTSAGAKTSSSMEQPGHAQAMSVERIAAELKTFTMNAADIVIAKDGSTDLTITAKDESDADVNLGTITYTITPQDAGKVEGGMFTGLKSGWVTITASPSELPGRTATAQVFVYDNETTPAPATVKGDNVWYNGDDVKKLSDAGWDWGSTQSDFTFTEGNSGRLAINWGTLMGPAKDSNIAQYKSIHVDVFPLQDGTMNISLEGATSTEAYTKVVGGKWNSLDISLDEFSGVENTTYLKLRGKTAENKKTTDGIILKNVYFSNKEVVKPLTITEGTNGWTVVTGNVTNADLSQIEALDVTALDISKASLASDITSITTKNPNTLIRVSGSKEGDVITSAQADQLTNTKNLVYKNDYIFPIKKLEFVDGHDIYSNFFISTGSKGYSYTRVIPAGALVSTMVPAPVYNIPAGLTVYDFDTNSTQSNVIFNKATMLSAAVPHLVHNSTDADITLTVEGTNDLNMAQPASATINGNGVQFIGNYAAKAGTGNEYALQNAKDINNVELRQVLSTANIPAFRAYLTGVSAAAKISFRGVITNIGTINGKRTINDGKIYTLDGRQVKDMSRHGIYIINGHKIMK